jgi:hypothetical protein
MQSPGSAFRLSGPTPGRLKKKLDAAVVGALLDPDRRKFFWLSGTAPAFGD